MPQMTIQQALELARAHHQRGNLREAESIFRQLLAANPDPLIFNDLANLLADAGRFDEAISAYRQAIALHPGYAEAFHNLATVFETLGRPDEAIQANRDALAQNPNLAATHYNLGRILHNRWQLNEAIAEYRRAIELQPDSFETYGNLGTALKDAGRIDEAIQALTESLRISPDHPETNRNLAGALLLKGDLSRGFEAYSRWRELGQYEANYRALPQPQWDGTDLNGRRILVYESQGFGDIIQFVRYIPLLAERGGGVVFACPKELCRLLASVKGIDTLFTDGDPWPTFDVRSSLLDLPRLFHTTMETIPASTPYINASRDLVDQWRERISETGSALKIGLAWSGRKIPDPGRSIPSQLMSAITAVEGCQFFSLQHATPQADEPAAVISEARDFSSELHDFAETSALIANLDLVITIDTAVAHLAGAMGKPTWTLLPLIPDWRWQLHREDCPWYPTMRLLRQTTRGDWSPAIAQAAQMLAQIVADKRA